MNGLIKKTVDAFGATQRILKAFGPYLVSQSEVMSDKYLEYKLKDGHVEAAATLLAEEAKSIASTRDALRKKYFDASPEERIQIRSDMEILDGEAERLKVFKKGIEHLPKTAARITVVDVEDGTREEEAPETTAHWIDEFNQLSRKRLEPWRQDLLGRAISLENCVPGNVNLRTLWAIGVLDEAQFHAFSTLLDLSSVIRGGYIIPTRNERVTVPPCELGENLIIGNLTYLLNDTEILGYRSTHKHVAKDEHVYAQYRSQWYRITSTKDWTLHGVCASNTGSKIALFYDERTTDLGQQLFDQWLKKLEGQDQFSVEESDADEMMKMMKKMAE
jgi:hypothetical protein